MKRYTSSLFAILAFGLFSLPVLGGDSYHATMTGCTDCTSCKKKVVMSFAELEGVEGVRFLKEKKGELFQVVIETDGSNLITAETASEVLKPLPHYELKSWQKVVPTT